MNEIEKMYENAKVEKHLAYFECHRGRSSMRCCPINSDDKDEGCSSCFFRDKMKEVYEYPPFTAEKQLKLLQICFDKLPGVIGKVKGVDRCILYISPGPEEEEAFVVTDYINFETWEETIAGLVNYFWQDLTEKEKQQIKEILE